MKNAENPSLEPLAADSRTLESRLEAALFNLLESQCGFRERAGMTFSPRLSVGVDAATVLEEAGYLEPLLGGEMLPKKWRVVRRPGQPECKTVVTWGGPVR